MNVTWNLQIERGAHNPTFNARAILEAQFRISYYWPRVFTQVGQRPWMTFILTNRRVNPSWAAWTTGRTIYIPTTFKYQSYAQLIFVMLHEMGHVFRTGNFHASNSRNVMFASINDVYKNFNIEDPQWYGNDWVQGKPRPWLEPNRWRPLMGTQEPIQPCVVGHGSWWDTIQDLFTKRDVVEVF